MTDLQKRFVEEYCIVWKGATAAVRAGYAKNRAKQTGYDLLQDPEILAAIKERQQLISMTAEEATKRISDTARTRLNDYITTETVWESSYEKRPLAILIAELQQQIDIDEEYADRVTLSDKEQDELFVENEKRKRQIIRYEIELERNPKAYRIQKGEPKPIKRPTVDLIKLAKADEEGAIKKFSFNERGLPSVEMYAADSAQETILKLHGKLVNKHDHTSNGKSFFDFLVDTSADEQPEEH